MARAGAPTSFSPETKRKSFLIFANSS